MWCGVITVLVTGSRTWDDGDYIAKVLDAVVESQPNRAMTLVHGACPQGADDHADRWYRARRMEFGHLLTVRRWPANWAEHGKRAGILRNEQMVRSGVDLCLAFIRDESKGASHCARFAEEHEVETRIFRWEDR